MGARRSTVLELGSAFAPGAMEGPLTHTGPSCAAFSRVVVHRSAAAAEEAWGCLERVAPISGYQTRNWLLPWIDTVGRHHGLEPMLVVALAPGGEPVAMLPLALERRRGVSKASFLGRRDANYNLGLFAPGVYWSRRDLHALLRGAVRASGARIDYFDLRNQPRTWRGMINPLIRLRHGQSPSFSAFGRLQPNVEAFFTERVSRETRKTLGKKERRLVNRFGPLRHVIAREPACVQTILAAFERQKSRRLRTSGLPDLFSDTTLMEFLQRAATERLPHAAVELHALYAGERIVATFGGTGHAKRFSGMFISFDDEIEVARSSPGDQLLRKVVAAKCREGYEIFDLGVGEALYKTGYCDEVEPLFDATFAITPLGHALALGCAFNRRLKRTIKQTPRLWQLACWARRLQHRVRA